MMLYPVCPLCPQPGGQEWEDLAVPPSVDQEGLRPTPGALRNSVTFTRVAPNPPVFRPAQPGIGLPSTFKKKKNQQLNQLVFVEIERGQNNMLLACFDVAPPVCPRVLQVGPSVCPPVPGQTPPGQPMHCKPRPCFQGLER